MGVLDDIRAIAQQRDNYDPGLTGTAIAPARSTFATIPSRPPVRPSKPRNGGQGTLTPAEIARYRELAAQRQAKYSTPMAPLPPDTGGEGSSPLDSLGSAVGGAFMGALDLADKGRQVYQGVAGEVGDMVAGIVDATGLDDTVFGEAAELGGNVLLGNYAQLRGLRDPETGERDKSFDFDQLSGSGMGQGFLGRVDWDDDLPGVVRAPIGVAGDLATDPLTYLTAGTAGVVKGGAGAAARTIPAARKVLAQRAASVSDDVIREVGKDVVDDVVRNVGKRGRGALTDRAVARSSYTVDDLAKMGLQDDFKYNVGFGSARVNVAGSGRAAQTSENLKGAIKAWTGGGEAGAKLRRMFNTGLEAKLTTAVLQGSADAPTAARGLAVLGQAKGTANRWAAETMHEAAEIVKKMDPDDARVVTRMLETGVYDGSDAGIRAANLAAFFKKAGLSLQEAGVDLPFLRDGYAPHRATDEAMRAAKGGDDSVKRALGIDPAKEEAFQKARVEGGGTIEEINARWRADGHDFDLLETDIRKTTEQYVIEGQQALLRHGLVGDEARRMGLVDDLGKAIDGEAVEAAIKEQTDKNLAAMSDAARARAKALSTGRKQLKKSRVGLKKRVKAGEVKVTAAKREVDRLTAIHATAQRKLESLEAAAEGLRVQLQKASATEKRKLTRRLNDLDGRRPALQRNLTTAKTKLTKRQGEYNELRSNVVGARTELETHDSIIRALSEERAKMNSQAVTRSAVDAEDKALKAEAAVAKQREEFVNPKWDDVESATRTKAWATADQTQLEHRTAQAIGRIDDWMQSVADLPSRKGSEGVVAYAAGLSDQMTVLKKLLNENPSKSTINKVLRLEAQAVDADIAALTASTAQRKIERAVTPDIDGQIAALTDPKFEAMVRDQTKDGFELIAREFGESAQINSFYSDALRTLDDINFGDLSKGVERYLKAQNWWKGMALASPGFLVRNFMGGLFNMYLDNIPLDFARQFSRYHKRIMDDGLESADDWARKTFGVEDAARMNEAATVAAATGDGQAASEYAGKILGSANKKLNIFSPQHTIQHSFRMRSAAIESGLRGGHAYGVLKQGGDYAEALSRVQKFHFNYNDLGKFDEAAKMVSPFWTFFSRNLALQMQVYAKAPNKITRTYYNWKRNVEEGLGFDEDQEFTPWYMGRGGMQGMRTGLSLLGDDVGPVSITPDIPSVRFPGQMANMADSKGLDLAGQLNPILKIPIQGFTNHDQFLGNEYRNELTEFDGEGETSRNAPLLFNLPGVRNAINLLPGTEIIDDQLVIQDNVEAQLMQTNPYIQRGVGLMGDSSGNASSGPNAWSGFFGGLGRFNSPQSQDAGQYFENKKITDAAYAVQEEIKLRKLVREGKNG